MRTRTRQRQPTRRATRSVSPLPGGTLLSGADALMPARVMLANPACNLGESQHCEHVLVDRELNKALYGYEGMLQARFDGVDETLKAVAELPRDEGFVARAQQLACTRLGCELPAFMLQGPWIAGLDMPALYAHCLFEMCRHSVAQAPQEQQSWLKGMAIDDAFLTECGYHTLDITPCADGRLQGVLPFVLRIAPTSDAVVLKAYAGALFDIELDMADWSQRELAQRLSGRRETRYLKMAVYHYSSSKPSSEGCAAHGSDEQAARDAAIDRLRQLRNGIAQAFGAGLGPDVLLLGVDTDLDAIRVHFPDANGEPTATATVDAARIYRETLGMTAEQARAHIASAVEQVADKLRSTGRAGMKALIARLLEANLSQIEYVIQHHEGRYESLGHGERFICVGDPIDDLQMRNLYYFAHLDTLEEGAACVDVGMHIFEKLNLSRGFPIPVIVHFSYASVIPGARERVIERGERVMSAIQARYRDRMPSGMIKFALCVSDATGAERLALVRECVTNAQAGNSEGMVS
ncbi:carboxysome shell carbonic anhydrase [Acidihalobacter yilgarnensis]|uniref:Carboxysome shell carbonic anhydrase n=1 Tax=Acidihalobacter yilgarnensis TaxID=2819280 RepID=A0A1D8IK57_9GAMM|nr:carboxysome shell carbonic anhydrase [Acidihalobacter yilgarnensis]AOU96860.1 carboxysome shell carbonic anhydrase [Acidihalobacter yilgarnensis]